MNAIGFIGLVWTVSGRCYEMEFSMNTPLHSFDVSQLPSEIECVEIVRVIHG